MNTNSSPRNIAILSAFLVALVPVLVGVVVQLKVLYILVLFTVTLVLGYVIISSLLERFIYRKIKIIYKNIHAQNTKHLSQDKRIDPISKVSDDVSAWAKERKEEVDGLLEQEKFRREFVGNVSHELKTPIFHIQGYIHTLLEGALSDPEVNYKFLEKTANSVERLIELVDDLTSINQIESKELQMQMESFDIRTLVEEVQEEVGYLLQERETEFSFSSSARVMFMVHADRLKIRQVLVNLIVNAIKYGKEKGSIKCGIYDMDENILVEISDNGEGIPESSIPRVFERFYRVEKSRTRNAGGSGLGLSIAKHIVEAHGQTIHVKSELGTGSSFGFTLSKSTEKAG